MIHFTSSLEKEFNKTSKGIITADGSVLVKMQELCSLLENAFDRLRIFIREYSFKDEAEEILFFKEIKPKLFCHLIFYRKIYDLEINRPTGGECIQKEYLENELGHIKYYFDNNRAFYNYYRSGDSSMDLHYFMRQRSDVYLCQESFYFERDPLFSTLCDFKVAKILANEKVVEYLREEIQKLIPIDRQDFSSKLLWTGNKNELVELIYSLHKSRRMNYGKLSLKEAMLQIQQLFNVDLGNYSRTYNELQNRKNCTTFLEYLKKLLDDDINERLN